jgi:hypothetical protein
MRTRCGVAAAARNVPVREGIKMQDESWQWALRLLVAAAVLALVLPAQAQFGSRMGQGGGRSGRTTRDSQDAEHNAETGQQLADRLYELRVRLLITTQQSAAWEGFYNAFLAMQAQRGTTGTPGSDMTAQQAMDLVVSATQTRQARVQALADALKALQAQLDESQRQAADQLLPPLLLRAAGAAAAARER